jgi:hypothetical protein
MCKNYYACPQQGNKNLEKAGDKFLAHDIEIKLPLLWASIVVFTHSITKAFLDSLPDTAGDIHCL